jgi:hypothetical protein
MMRRYSFYLVLTGFPGLILSGAAIFNEIFLLDAPLLLLPAWRVILKDRGKWRPGSNPDSEPNSQPIEPEPLETSSHAGKTWVWLFS